jgi:methyl-accepting chemotaxis protein
MKPKYKRRTYYIKNSAQSKFIVRFVTLSLLGGAIALGAFNFLAYKKIDAALYSMRLPSISPGGLLWPEMLYTNLFVIIFILAAFAITAKGLFNKINGPLKKMTYDITRINNGDLNTTVFLRQSDEFRDIADDLTQMTTGLKQRITTIKTLTETIISHAETNSQDNTDQSYRDTLTKKITALRQAIEAFSL